MSTGQMSTGQMTAPNDQAFTSRMERIEALVAEIETLPPGPPLEAARSLVAALLELHGAGLAQVLAIASANGEAGIKLVEAMTVDPLVGSLLVLHDVHPQSLASRVEGALDSVRAAFREKPAITLIGIVDGVVQLRVDDVPAGGAARLRRAIEDAVLAAAPDATSLDLAMAGDTVLVPASRLYRRNASPGNAP